MDFGGTLTVISEAESHIRKGGLEDFRVTDAPWMMSPPLNYLMKLDHRSLSVGIEGSLALPADDDLNVDEIIALIALYRPGPWTGCRLHQRQGRSRRFNFSSLLEDVCAETQGDGVPGQAEAAAGWQHTLGGAIFYAEWVKA